MDLQSIIEKKNMSRYRLSKISGVPKTTINDICSGKSNIERCSAKTVKKLAEALECTMEELMELADDYDENGFPKDNGYLECGLPQFLQNSIEAMKEAWRKVDNGEEYIRWDCDYCNLQSDINSAEVEQLISEEQAWFLREKYLRIERE